MGKGTHWLLQPVFSNDFALDLQQLLHQSGPCGFLPSLLQSLWLWFLSSAVAIADKAQLLLFSQMSAYPQLPNTLTEPAVSTRTWARHWSLINVKIDHDLQVVHRQLLTCLTNTGAWAALTNSGWFCLVISENDEEQEALLSLDKPGWYSQGNAIQLYELLKKMTGKLDPKVCYKLE